MAVGRGVGCGADGAGDEGRAAEVGADVGACHDEGGGGGGEELGGEGGEAVWWGLVPRGGRREEWDGIGGRWSGAERTFYGGHRVRVYVVEARVRRVEALGWAAGGAAFELAA